MVKDPSARISATIITLNEEKNIRECLESLSWADEIVVLDSESHDRTVEIARDFTDKVFIEPWTGQGAHKNRAMDLAQGPWIFSIDADERVTPELATEIRDAAGKGKHHAYALRRKNIYRGQWIRHSGWWPDWVTRLFRKGQARFNDRMIHEALTLEGPIGRLEEPLLHYSFEDVGSFIERASRYATHLAEMMYCQGKRASLLTALSHASFECLNTYLFRRGFLDGGAGVLIAVSNGVGTFYKYMMLREKGLPNPSDPEMQRHRS
jgi:glycosyltransferase involved in cell wall biosynthesis